MSRYPIHTIDSAPEKSKPALQGLQSSLGLVPNLAATMASSPPLVNGFVGTFAQFHGSAFSGAEKQVLLLTNAVTNRCAWAVAFHSTLALGEGVGMEDVQRIRNGELPSEPRLAALSVLTRSLIEQRGHIDDAALEAFTRSGFADDHVLDVIAGVAVSTMANYAGNITDPVLEQPFQSQVWSPP